MKKIFKEILCITALFCFILFPQVSYSYDIPDISHTVGVRQEGDIAHDSTSTPNTTIYTQDSLNAVLTFGDYSVGKNETVQYIHKLGASSITLNKVTGDNPSHILGRILANGRVFIINRNGVIFGRNATIDVGGLVASTLDISNADFMAGNYIFTHTDGDDGSVVNFGQITAKTGGYVALLAPHVNNSGNIRIDNTAVFSSLGKVVLASGEKITLGLDAGKLISVVVNDEITQNLTNADAAIENHGTLEADGGQVLLTAKTLNTVFDQAINNQGIIEANALSGEDGQIALLANNDIVVAGRVEAEGDITIDSTDGNVSHQVSFVEGELKGIVRSISGDFTGNAAKDYILRNGTEIDVPFANFNMSFGDNLVLGSDANDLVTVFNWEYLEGYRDYLLRDFGYYTMNADGSKTFHPLMVDYDMRAGAGSGSVYGNDKMELYATFIGYWRDSYTYYTKDSDNYKGEKHVEIVGDRYAWEDRFKFDSDYNDAILNFTTTEHHVFQKPVIPTPTVIASTGFYHDEFPVYYEILSPSQFMSFEPATTIGLYAYHPLTPVDQAAFDDIQLDIDAYEFVEENIRRKKDFSPYFVTQ